MVQTKKTSKLGSFQKFIGFVEKAGNKLPHPFMLFVGLSLFVLILSFILNKMGVSVTYLAASKKAGEAAAEVTVGVTNLLEPGFLKGFLADFVSTYVGFKPLGLVMVMMLGIGFVEETGFFNAVMKKTLLGVPAYLVTFILAMVGVCANIASDAGIIFAATMGAAIFAGLGRNPILGATVGYVSGHGGFTANLLISGTDGLLSGITASAASGMGIVAPTHPLINWYFMAVATFVIAICVTVVTEKVMPKIMRIEAKQIDAHGLENQGLTTEQNRGLKFAGIVTILYIGLFLIATVPQNGFLRNEAGALLPKSPFTESIVPLLFFLFIAIGTAYGFGSKILKNHRQIPKLMGTGLKGAISFLVIAFPASYFITFFNASNMATVIAVNGAKALESLHLNGIALAICFVLLTSFLNLFLTSGSAKWLILAPIFVPMFSIMNFSPALTQLAYRIGDSVTNPISPINFFIPVLIGLIQQYKIDDGEDVGLGTAISLTLPYSIAFMIGLVSLMVIWMAIGLPLGPGTQLWLQ